MITDNGRSWRIGVVIPCYNVEKHIEAVIRKIPDIVDHIYCVDDCSRDDTAQIIKKIADKRIKIITHSTNKGVGAAVISGYQAAITDQIDIVAKIDGDGQMNPEEISRFVTPIIKGECDYTKGNRFYNIEDVKKMPKIRIVGNAALSFMTKLSSGYWHIFDPTNGYTAIHIQALKELPLNKIAGRYFFESDILFRLNTIRAAVCDIPMTAHYEDEESHLKITNILGPFLAGHFKNFGKRIFYNYFLRDFNVASLECLIAIPMLLFGIIFGILAWIDSSQTGNTASAGTVMLCALPIIVGVQFLLSFLNYDQTNTPKQPISEKLSPKN